MGRAHLSSKTAPTARLAVTRSSQNQEPSCFNASPPASSSQHITDAEVLLTQSPPPDVILSLESSVSMDEATYKFCCDQPSLCPLNFMAEKATPEDLAAFPARLSCADAYALFAVVRASWQTEYEPLLWQATFAQGVTVHTGLDVPQKLLSTVIRAIYSGKLEFASKDLQQLLYTADYLQAPCLLKALERYICEELLPADPARVYALGCFLPHLTLYQSSTTGQETERSYCEEAQQEVLRQISFHSKAHVSSTRWLPNEKAWAQALELMQRMDSSRIITFLGKAMDQGICAYQGATLFFRWLDMPQRQAGKQLEADAVMNALCQLLLKLSREEAGVMLCALNAGMIPDIDKHQWIWFPLYRSLTLCHLHKKAEGVTKVAILVIPIGSLLGPSTTITSTQAVSIRGVPHSLLAERVEKKDWGLYLKNASGSCQTREEDVIIFGALRRLTGWQLRMGHPSLEICGIKGTHNSSDWLPYKGSRIVDLWAKEDDLLHDVNGEISLVIAAKVFCSDGLRAEAASQLTLVASRVCTTD